MPYPDQSNFVSDVSGSAWWLERRQPGDADPTVLDDIIETEGLTFMGLLQDRMQRLHPTQCASPDGIAPNWNAIMRGRWTLDFARGLYCFAYYLEAPDNALRALAADLAAKTVGTESLHAAIYALRTTMGDHTPAYDDIIVMPTAAPPPWNEYLPVPRLPVQGAALRTRPRYASIASTPSGPSIAGG